jgi:S-adenosyl methyltransferase
VFRRRDSEAGKNQAAVASRPRHAAPAGHDAGPVRHDAEPRPDAAETGREQREPWGPPPAGLDVSLPHPARVWNYWLGGRDFFAADKAAGEEIGREFPHLAEVARAERAFLVRAVRFLAGPARIRQFLDVGSGLPAGGNTHEIAQRIVPDTGIVYADNDPAVILHAKALLSSPMLASTTEGAVYYADADLRDVAAVLAAASTTLDLSRPVALIMLGILGHVDDYGAARSITSQLLDELAPGSYLVIADGVALDTTGAVSVASAQRRYDATARPRYGASAPPPYRLRRPDELASFFDGLDLTEPGVVPCSQWRPDGRERDGAGKAAAYCGVARKP